MSAFRILFTFLSRDVQVHVLFRPEVANLQFLDYAFRYTFQIELLIVVDLYFPFVSFLHSVPASLKKCRAI